jgi:hypothetical protein
MTVAIGRDYRKEMFACIIGAFQNGPHNVQVTVKINTETKQPATFRCVPSVKGGVILYLGNARKQYTHLDKDEWVTWATENGQ